MGKKWDKVFFDKLEPVLSEIHAYNRVIFFILKKGDRGNPVTYTTKSLAEELNLSERYIQRIVAFMIKNDLMRRSGNGVIFVNPRVVFQGGHQMWQVAQINYDKLKPQKKENKYNNHDPETGEVFE